MGIQNAAKFDSCRPTVELSRRRGKDVPKREGADDTARMENAPDHAGRLQRLLGRSWYISRAVEL
jgi:hypothetical protein